MQHDDEITGMLDVPDSRGGIERYILDLLSGKESNFKLLFLCFFILYYYPTLEAIAC